MLVPLLFILHKITLLIAPRQIISELLAVFLAEGTAASIVASTLNFHAAF